MREHSGNGKGSERRRSTRRPLSTRVAVKTDRAIFSSPFALPESIDLSQWAEAWEVGNLGQYVVNSAIVTAASVTLILVIGSAAAYAFSRFRFRGRTFAMALFVLGLLLPLQSYFIAQSRLFVDKSVFKRDDDSSTGNDAEEVAANKFAAALLMPAALVRSEIAKQGLDLDDEDDVATLALTNTALTRTGLAAVTFNGSGAASDKSISVYQLTGGAASNTFDLNGLAVAAPNGTTNTVLSGAWNSLGELYTEDGKSKRSTESLTDAYYMHLRGIVQYTPAPGEPTFEYERALFDASNVCRFISELESNGDRKRIYKGYSDRYIAQLTKEFPNSAFLKKK